MGALDISGQDRSAEVMHHVFKQRLGKDGNPLGSVERNKIGDALRHEEELQKAAAKKDDTQAAAEHKAQKCGSCYGAGAPGQCCTSCDEVRELYRKKGCVFNLFVASATIDMW